ncbi:hypothetical protein AN963_07565 [Brevibacillus choshinensis]|uniref:Uncharacterized protein n=1 Tax=Brevibacillus choshinensis TaxID=54911 RepID=A0ABR5NDD8_BRECH|nr:hypothetical protein [Brevibacillus choshinensis]KQL49581.1 hypothetical protein AN963_07565 [Brevibacillus choshinensis]
MGEKWMVGIIVYFIVMGALVIPGLLDTDWSIFKSERRNKIVLKWYLFLGNALAIGIAIFAVVSIY